MFVHSIIMRIDKFSYYNNYNYPIKKQSFRGQVGYLTDVADIIKCRGNTEWFRSDIAWSKIAKFLSEKYHDVKNVLVVCHACSSGEEPYSLRIKLKTDLGVEADKFSIIARDLSPSNIEKAKDGRLTARYTEMEMITKMTNGHPEKFADIITLGNSSVITPDENKFEYYKSLMSKEHLVVAKEKLKEDIDFAVGNIFDDIKTYPEQNTVLFLRNVWQYFTGMEREYLMSEISRKFADDSSVLFIGRSDIDNSNIPYLLEKYNFIETDFPLAYVKNKEQNSILKYLNPQNAVYLQ